MDEEDIVYGLGESNRGINKRGFIYTSNCTDDPEHTEDKHSLYGAHNLIIVSGKETFGMFFDYPAAITFDIGYTRMDTMKVTCENVDLKLYVIEGESPYDIVKQFRHVIGRSYIRRNCLALDRADGAILQKKISGRLQPDIVKIISLLI